MRLEAGARGTLCGVCELLDFGLPEARLLLAVDRLFPRLQGEDHRLVFCWVNVLNCEAA